MLTRTLKLPLHPSHSIWLMGPSETGKSSWLKANVPSAFYLDLRDQETYTLLSANPGCLDNLTAGTKDWVIIDEISLCPELLNMAHLLIEARKTKFIITCSSWHKLRRPDVNLLGGRAILYAMHPLTIQEIGDSFNLQKILAYGLLPAVIHHPEPQAYLDNYVQKHVQTLHEQNPGNDMLVILQDLMLVSNVYRPLGIRKERSLLVHEKFYCIDVGILQALVRAGILDHQEISHHNLLATLFLQSLRAINDYHDLDYQIHFWQPERGPLIDFIVLGKHGFHAFVIDESVTIMSKSLKGLKKFGEDYPEAKLHILHVGKHKKYFGNIIATPFEEALRMLPEMIG